MARFRFDQFCFDTDRKALLRGGEPVRLTPRAFRLLELLLMRRPKAVSKRDLLDYVWSGAIVEEANLKTLVLEIRTALEERGGRPEVVRTVYGFGYAFAGDVEEEEDGEPKPGVLSVRWDERSVLLPYGAHLIGRRPDCAVVIDANSVSRVHARLEITRDGMRIEDLNSKNGTYVGGQKITGPAELFARCEVVIGEVAVKLARLDSKDASTETVAPR
ncbi:MAG TPA: FHA domain-containing protein [Thermoanaerobaculia bacterium]|nr:FHA domain-containing protein [Thermoanaerobaculia bacterium]